MTAKGSRGSASTKLLVVVALALAVVAGLYAYRAKSTPSLEGTWGSKDLLGGMVITKTTASMPMTIETISSISEKPRDDLIAPARGRRSAGDCWDRRRCGVAS